ncbi:indole-3-glycerol phosphate synthase [Eubacterium ruminantium]|nr:indole-3-glycerol phosphate synthase [Eubacterium ruminantium]
MSFSEALRKKKSEGKIPVVVDFKCISPGAGRLIESDKAPEYARKMEEAGAPAISVVTEPKDFGGSLDLLRNIVDVVNIPVLRKDFIRTREEIDISIDCGADAVLLMCSVMSEEEMRDCYSYAVMKGIEPLVETHTLQEMKLAASLGAKLVGINNRNILQLEKDGGTVETTRGLMKEGFGSATERPFLISESGILTPEDVETAIKSGMDAVLIGTAVWKAENPFEYLKELSEKTW